MNVTLVQTWKASYGAWQSAGARKNKSTKVSSESLTAINLFENLHLPKFPSILYVTLCKTTKHSEGICACFQEKYWKLCIVRAAVNGPYVRTACTWTPCKTSYVHTTSRLETYEYKTHDYLQTSLSNVIYNGNTKHAKSSSCHYSILMHNCCRHTEPYQTIHIYTTIYKTYFSSPPIP